MALQINTDREFCFILATRNKPMLMLTEKPSNSTTIDLYIFPIVPPAGAYTGNVIGGFAKQKACAPDRGNSPYYIMPLIR